MQKLFYETKFATDDTGRVSGVAWKFSSPDRVDDIIEPAAFAAAVGKSLPILHNHDTNQVVGVWESVAVEGDDLKVEGKLLVGDVARATEIHKLLQAKAITGLSVGFLTKKSFARKGGGRTITDLDLLEVSLTAVPAHDGARISNVKAVDSQKDQISMENTAVDTKALSDLETRLNTRLDSIEAKANRLTADNDNGDAKAERKAFDHYLRRYGTAGYSPDETKALNTGDDGAVVPETFLAEIIKNITEFSPMRQLARITNVNGSSVKLPRRLTKPTAGVVAEGAAATGSESTYGEWDIPIYEVREFTDISNQLLEDSGVDMEAEIRMDLAEAFGEAEGNLLFTGTGTGQPLGLLADTDFVTADATGIALDPDELIDLFYGVKSTYSARGAWGMNRSVIAAVRKLKSTTSGEYLWQDSLANGQPATFMGKPVVEVPALGDIEANAIPVVFGDWNRGFRILDRINMTVMPDRYTRAANGQVRFHARRRFGGKLVRPEALIGLKLPAA